MRMRDVAECMARSGAWGSAERRAVHRFEPQCDLASKTTNKTLDECSSALNVWPSGRRQSYVNHNALCTNTWCDVGSRWEDDEPRNEEGNGD